MGKTQRVAGPIKGIGSVYRADQVLGRVSYVLQTWLPSQAGVEGLTNTQGTISDIGDSKAIGKMMVNPENLQLELEDGRRVGIIPSGRIDIGSGVMRISTTGSLPEG